MFCSKNRIDNEDISQIKLFFDGNKRSAIPKKMRDDVLRRDSYTCQHCGEKAPNVKLHVDHKIPVSKGGTNALSNLQTLCEECNLGKSNKYSE